MGAELTARQPESQNKIRRMDGLILYSHLYENETFKTAVETAVSYGINLGHADLRGAKLPGADLRGAKLCYANLSRADLSGADLAGADLSCAILGPDLSGVDLRRANLSGVVYLSE